MFFIARACSDAEVIIINLLLQLLGSGNMGEFSILDLGIVPPCGRADTVDLERNISPYCPPSHVHVIICDRIYEKGDNLRIINLILRYGTVTKQVQTLKI